MSWLSKVFELNPTGPTGPAVLFLDVALVPLAVFWAIGYEQYLLSAVSCVPRNSGILGSAARESAGQRVRSWWNAENRLETRFAGNRLYARETAVCSRAMYVKTTARKTKNGEVRYLQLAHKNGTPPPAGQCRRSSTASAARTSRPTRSGGWSPRCPGGSAADALAATADGDLVFTGSRPYGGAYVLDQLWTRLGIAKILAGLRPRGGAGRGTPPQPSVLFGLVATGAAPSSSSPRRSG